jgi:ABC-type uncharacterized transport system ATPase component
MFRITARTCRTFTVEEILILAAMNVETIGLASGRCIRRKTAGTQRGCLSASHFVRIRVREALHV